MSWKEHVERAAWEQRLALEDGGEDAAIRLLERNDWGVLYEAICVLKDIGTRERGGEALYAVIVRLAGEGDRVFLPLTHAVETWYALWGSERPEGLALGNPDDQRAALERVRADRQKWLVLSDGRSG